MKPLNVMSIIMAAAGLVTGIYAAYYWWKASMVQPDPGWRVGIPDCAEDAAKPIEPVDPDSKQMGWTAAMLEAASRSADLNKRAARLTAAAVFLSGLAGIAGALAGV